MSVADVCWYAFSKIIICSENDVQWIIRNLWKERGNYIVVLSQMHLDGQRNGGLEKCYCRSR